MTDHIYSNLRKANGEAVDVICNNGKIASIAAPGSTPKPAAAHITNGKGQLVLPSLVESHVHLDKTLWGLPWYPVTAGPALSSYIVNERQVLKNLTVPIAVRSASLLEHMIAQGSLNIRSHIDVAPDIGLRHVEAMLLLREKYCGLCDLQLVAFPQTGMLIAPGTMELMEEALMLGVDHVGGLDPAGIDGDPVAHLKIIFNLAVKYGRGVDIHLHDRGELGLWQIARIADFTEASGLQGRVMISHAYCLGMAPETAIARLARRLADLGISIMTAVPIDPAIPPVAFLRENGVTVCCGSDGIRDAWSPMGNGDMLERAFLLAFRFEWGKDSEFAAAFDCATAAGAKALGVAAHGLEVGRPANFMFLDAANIGDALCRRPAARSIVRHGEVIAETGKLLHSRVV